MLVLGSGKKIGIGIGITAVLIVAYLGLNIYAISSLQFRNHETGQFDFADMSIDAKIEACNPTFFPASFNKFDVKMVYKSTDFGTFTVWGDTIAPKSSSVVDGRFKLNGEAVAGLFLAALGSAFTGQSNFDPNQIRLNANLDAPILGIIPFSVSKEFSIDEFKNFMSDQNGRFDC